MLQVAQGAYQLWTTSLSYGGGGKYGKAPGA
jgi:hypothetical protein